MRHLGAVIALAAILSAAPARADIVTVPIPALAGQTDFIGTVPFSLPTLPSVIRSVSIRVVATADVGAIYCSSNDFTYPWPTAIHAFLRDPGWSPLAAGAKGPSTSGSFDVTQEFHSTSSDLDWDFLLDGRAELEFDCAPDVHPLNCDLSPLPPAMHVQEVDLIVDGDFPPLTWGRIKALYR